MPVNVNPGFGSPAIQQHNQDFARQQMQAQSRRGRGGGWGNRMRQGMGDAAGRMMPQYGGGNEGMRGGFNKFRTGGGMGGMMPRPQYPQPPGGGEWGGGGGEPMVQIPPNRFPGGFENGGISGGMDFSGGIVRPPSQMPWRTPMGAGAPISGLQFGGGIRPQQQQQGGGLWDRFRRMGMMGRGQI